MHTNKTTIKKLFNPADISFCIPPYQRAYAWGEKHWKQLLADLDEALESQAPYFFGNILLETLEEGRKYEIIDGQQRITTIHILLRSLLNYLQEEDSVRETIYFKNNKQGSYKLNVVYYDKEYYTALISENDDKGETLSTPSRKKIKEAKDFFDKAFENKSKEHWQRLLDKIEKTELWITYLGDKKSAALMFELQNNRGVSLTNMERLKAYIMYQSYLLGSPDNVNEIIGRIADIFGNIYKVYSNITNMPLIRNEDDILRYHCQAYHKRGYAYEISDLKDFKEDLKKIPNEEKVQWMQDFVQNLSVSFQHMEKWQNLHLPYWQNLKNCIAVFAYPFLLKGYKRNKENNEALNTLCRLMEMLCFRNKMISTRADITADSRLGHLLKFFEEHMTIDDLKAKIAAHKGWYYWNDDRLRNALNEPFYSHSHHKLYYLLARYEESLPEKGYLIKVQNAEIEHIAPQTYPKVFPSGYEDNNERTDYSPEFRTNSLYNLGNLAYISKEHNLEQSNKPFSNKLESYKHSPCKQHKELVTFIDNANQPLWDAGAINKRRAEIIKFVEEEWSFNF